jgi:hypothetical protein
MKYLLMALGAMSILTGLYYENTDTSGNPIHFLIGGYLGITLILGAIVVAIGERKK